MYLSVTIAAQDHTLPDLSEDRPPALMFPKVFPDFKILFLGIQMVKLQAYGLTFRTKGTAMLRLPGRESRFQFSEYPLVPLKHRPLVLLGVRPVVIPRLLSTALAASSLQPVFPVAVLVELTRGPQPFAGRASNYPLCGFVSASGRKHAVGQAVHDLPSAIRSRGMRRSAAVASATAAMLYYPAGRRRTGGLSPFSDVCPRPRTNH